MIRARLVGLWASSLLLGAVVVWSGAGPVRADYEENWWYEALGVPQAQAQGITGEGVPVAVVDWGIDPGMSLLADAHLTVREPSFCMDTQWYTDLEQQLVEAGHPAPELPAVHDGLTQGTYRGTNTVAWLVGNGRAPYGQTGVSGIAPGVDIRFYAIGNAEFMLGYTLLCGALDDAQAMAIVQAVDDGARIVLLKQTVMEPNSMMSDAVAYALHNGVIVVVPVETSNFMSSSRWVGGLNGVVAVEAAYSDGRPYGISSPAPPSATVTAPGDASTQGRSDEGRNGSWADQWYDTGPDVAATLVAGMLADAAQKWPEATNNQLVQSLIHSTGPGGHEPVHDPATGYGAASLLRLLEVDPTGHEDVNPLIVPDDGQELGLTAQDISDARRPAWADPAPPAMATPAVSPSPAPQSGHPDGVQGWVWWVVAALSLTVALGLVLRARARTNPAGPSDDRYQQPTTSTTGEG